MTFEILIYKDQKIIGNVLFQLDRDPDPYSDPHRTKIQKTGSTTNTSGSPNLRWIPPMELVGRDLKSGSTLRFWCEAVLLR